MSSNQTGPCAMAAGVGTAAGRPQPVAAAAKNATQTHKRGKDMEPVEFDLFRFPWARGNPRSGPVDSHEARPGCRRCQAGKDLADPRHAALTTLSHCRPGWQ